MGSVLTFRPIAVTTFLLLLAPGIARANYDPEHCKLVAGSLNIHWEGVAGTTCTGIEFTDGTVEDAVDGSISMWGVSTSDGCLATAAYAFTLSKDGRMLTGSDTANNVEMILTRAPGEGCFHGHAMFGDEDYVAHIAGDVFAAAASPICGDVNDSGSVNTSDALLVLRKGVGQGVSLPCSRYGNILDDYGFALSTTNADLTSCEADLADVESDLTETEANLSAYQPTPCPCWSGPATLAAILTDNLTGSPASRHDEDCQVINGANTHYFGITSDASFPPSGMAVSGDAKCRTEMNALVDYMQSAGSPRCIVERFVDEYTDPEAGTPDTDCEDLPAFADVDIGGLTTAQLDACAAQIPVAAALIPACVP